MIKQPVEFSKSLYSLASSGRSCMCIDLVNLPEDVREWTKRVVVFENFKSRLTFKFNNQFNESKNKKIRKITLLSYH